MGRERIEWLVEVVPKSEMSEVWREVGRWLVEIVTKREVSEGVGEGFSSLVECITKFKMRQERWKIVHFLIEHRSKPKWRDLLFICM
jgi:hypothetical protein